VGRLVGGAAEVATSRYAARFGADPDAAHHAAAERPDHASERSHDAAQRSHDAAERPDHAAQRPHDASVAGPDHAAQRPHDPAVAGPDHPHGSAAEQPDLADIARRFDGTAPGLSGRPPG
jgi:hypothetical protein